MNERSGTMVRLAKWLAVLAVVAWAALAWYHAYQAQQAGAAFHQSLTEAWGQHGCPPLETRQEILAAAEQIRRGEFRGVVDALGPAGPLTAEEQMAAQKFFAGARDEQKRFLAVVEAAKDQQRDGTDTAAVRHALADVIRAAAAEDARAVTSGIELAETTLDEIGMGPASVPGGDTAAEVAGMIGRIGPAYNLGRELMTEGHAAVEKLVQRASREYQAGQFRQAAAMVQLAAGLLGVDASGGGAAVTPKWFDELADAEPPVATEAQARSAVTLAEAMAQAESPGPSLTTLVEKARREFQAGRTSDAFWWASVALNALGMTDEAIAAATAEPDETPQP